MPAVNSGVAQTTAAFTVRMTISEGTFWAVLSRHWDWWDFALSATIYLNMYLSNGAVHTIYLPPWCSEQSLAHSRCSIKRQNKRGFPRGVAPLECP